MSYSILYAFDDNYAPFAGVSICSCMENANQGETFEIYALMDHVTTKNQSKFALLQKKYPNLKIYLIDCDDYTDRIKAANRALIYRGAYAPILRLFFIDFIKRGTKRLLYLDCDTIVLGSLSELFATDMKREEAVAVVVDSLGGYYKRQLHFKDTDQYFNSGVVLFDVDNWINGKYKERILKVLSSNHTVNPDQDILNIVLKDSKKIISPCYNFQPVHMEYSDREYFRVYSKTGYYSSNEIDFAREKPIIVHSYRYLGQFPWYEDSIHPATEMFYKYLKLSPWGKDFVPIKNTKAFFSIERKLYSILPRQIFLKMFMMTHNVKFDVQSMLRKMNASHLRDKRQ